jgi:hypothetical protein
MPRRSRPRRVRRAPRAAGCGIGRAAVRRVRAAGRGPGANRPRAAPAPVDRRVPAPVHRPVPPAHGGEPVRLWVAERHAVHGDVGRARRAERARDRGYGRGGAAASRGESVRVRHRHLRGPIRLSARRRARTCSSAARRTCSRTAIAPIEGLVEADWAVATFAMHWKLTRVGHPVTFEAGEPFCMIVPQGRGELETLRPVIRPIEDDPELLRQYPGVEREPAAELAHAARRRARRRPAGGVRHSVRAALHARHVAGRGVGAPRASGPAARSATSRPTSRAQAERRGAERRGPP